MKRTLLLLPVLFCFLLSEAQPKIKDKKYPSLLWEISGKGLAKPSFLIGTMHVSNKLAFHLPDSFYIAIRNAQVVALETNPETWQEDMSKYDLSGGDDNYYPNNYYGSYRSVFPDEYLGINTLKFFRYDSKIEKALYSSPATINNLLYRSYGNETSDFEEDTYLDMYIFQCGKKWGKRVTGVEDYGESMRLMAEAYKDAAKEKNKKLRSYDGADDYSGEKLQEAYRNGDLDLLDSINKYNSTSAAFDEKFLYRRNEIQAHHIDSIIRAGNILFVGVGAAHLPGDRGVIELLRKKGYKLRPVKMGERDSRDKDIVDKIRVPVTFRTEAADDSLFTVDIPGKFYQYDKTGSFGDDRMLLQKQYADMSNGSYYMVTRIMTNAWMWSHSADDVYKRVDSLLYENVPGKIISKTTITKNGFRGFDITNRTRRGDLQRYQIFITPFEIIFFKMSGNGDYVKFGDEARRFFSSIRFREHQPANEPATGKWKKYTPPYGGFAVDLPHDPYIGNDGSWIYDAEDKSTGTQYRVIRTDIHNYHFVEEDTFDLGLMNESFMASEFIDTQISKRSFIYGGYPSLDGKYKDKSGAVFLTRFLIRGPHYYTLIAHGRQEIPAMQHFLNSFEIKPFIYPAAKQQTDTSLYFSVSTPVYPYERKIKLDIPRYNYYPGSDEEEESEDDQLEGGTYRNKIIKNDTTGEKIFVSFYRSNRYYYTKDSSAPYQDSKEREHAFFSDTTFTYRYKKKWELPGNMEVWESIVSDTGSSRAIRTKTFYRDGTCFSLCTQLDTLTPPGDFIKNFFETFTPADTLKGINPFEKKSNLFFADFLSKDSVLHRRAVKYMDDIEVDSADLLLLKKAIQVINWDEKKYLETKKSLINKIGDINTKTASDYLKELYYALDDTIQLQYAALESLLQHRTAYAFSVFRDIVNAEPPVLDNIEPVNDYSLNSVLSSIGNKRRYRYHNGYFLDELSDSLQLTKTILPDLLPLLNLEDYKKGIMKLLGEMVDSNQVGPNDYELYYSKFLVEAKQELKKQSIAEKKKAIEKAEESKNDKEVFSYYTPEDEQDSGNEDLDLYATLLLPFWESRPAVQTVLQQMLKSNDRQLKYSTMLLLLAHHKPFPDSLPGYFAGLDDYRYQFYSDLKSMKRMEIFPDSYNNHLDLGKSFLLEKESYDKPDSVVYLDRIRTEYKGKKGFVYFYKYKEKKDDMAWKLATVGLVPEDPKQFGMEDDRPCCRIENSWPESDRAGPYDFTGFTDTKIETDEPPGKQMNKVLKKLLYSRRSSARKFYEDDDRTISSYHFD